ncbi:DUF1003 domain-containing protein [Massilia sp. TWR1-2-2]|uniref:DUF1003 domain-containing protein n=1 Tax=Massilia sp. TWR1-2-2 TaxID=2804584 RepID=UPI003CF2343D
MKHKRNHNQTAESAQQKSSHDRVAEHIAARRPISRTLLEEPEAASFGQRAADAVARFGGSWTFIMLFALVLCTWVLLNSWLLARNGGKGFDPYPYILLNLFLSMLASIQAPVILMSQNRQGEKDRRDARHDYEINLKAELEIISLHEKIDALKVTQWEQLIALQREQIRMLSSLCGVAPRQA